MLSSIGKFITSGLQRYVLPLILIAGLTYVAIRLVQWAADEIDKRIVEQTEDDDRRQRIRTLLNVAKNTANVVILVGAILIALGTVGIDIGPALAAVGVLGLALSLGAQTLIKDVIGGAIVLLEDQYRVGDTIKIGAITGDVERITLRRTDVRDAEGRLFIVSNGDIRSVANETRKWARAMVDLHFSFITDLGAAAAALNKAMAKAAEEPKIKQYLLEAPEVQGWNQFDNWSVLIRLRAKVLPGKQGDVARVMRRYALEELNAAGVAVESYIKSSQPNPDQAVAGREASPEQVQA